MRNYQKLCSDSFIPWNKVVLQMLTIDKLVKMFILFTKKVLTIAYNWVLS